MKKQKKETVRKKEQGLNANPTDKNAQKVVSCEEWTNFNTYEKSIYTNLSIERLAKQFIQWAKDNPDAIKINQFLELTGIHRRSWNRWCQKYDVLQEAAEHVKMIIGNRREFGMLTRKYAESSSLRSIGIYCEEWNEHAREIAKITNKDGNQDGGQKIVIIEKYPDSPSVPHKKEEE